MSLLSPTAASSMRSPSRSSGGSHLTSPAAPIVPHFDRYAGRPELDVASGAASVPPAGVGVHTSKKQRERTETARSVLSGMSWRFLTEGVMDERDYAPPPVLTQPAMDYVARLEKERAEAASRASNHSDRRGGIDSPEPSSLRRSVAGGSGFQTPTSASGAHGGNGSSSLLTGMLSPPLHSAYYSPPVAPAPLQGRKSAFEAQMNSPVAHLFAGGAFSFAAGSNSKQSRAQEALEDAQWKPPPPAVGPAGAPRSKSPLKRFDADTPVVRRAREAARNAKADYLQRHHPVNPVFNTPEMRNRLPPLAPVLTASQLNITTETQTRVEGAPMLGLGVTREAALAATSAAEIDDDPYSSFHPESTATSAPKRMESTYTGLEQAIIDMTAASIRESKAQALPRPTPQPKKKTKKSNDITAQFEKKQAALARKKAKDAAHAQAQLQAQHALAQQQQAAASSTTGLKIITDESHSHAVNTLTLTHEDGSPIIPPPAAAAEEKESLQKDLLVSLPLLPRMPTPRNQYSSESEDSTAYTSSSSSSSDAEADDFAEERAERVAQARAFHASLRTQDDASASEASSSVPGSSMGGRKGVSVGDQRPGDTPSASSLIVWRENHRVQAARDIPASVAAQLLAEPTAEDRMEQLQRMHRAEEEAEALAAAAEQAEAELEAEMKAMNDAATASAAAASNEPAPPTPQHIRFAQARDGLREFQPQDPQPLPASPFPMLVPGTPVLRPDPVPLIAASEYADPSRRFEAEHTPLLAKAAAIIDKEVRFDYLSQQAAKIAAAAAQKKAKADEAKVEEMLDSGGSRAAIHALLGGSRAVTTVVRPEFKFQLYPERGNKTEMREQLFAGLSADQQAKGVLSPQQKRRKEALARREAARAAREAASPSPSNPLPAFRPTHARPHAFDPLASSSFVPPVHITSPKKKLGAWYLPAKQWRSVEVARDNDEQRAREEAEEAAHERAEYEASLPRSMQEKSAWLRESIPTLFIASVYKGHLESISKAQQAAAAREAKELAAQERNAGYQFHRGKLPPGPGAGAGAGGRARGISAVLVTPPPATGATGATTVAGSLNSTTTSLGPVVRGGSATSTASSPTAAAAPSAAAVASVTPPDPLAHTPVRMPSYLETLIPLDSTDDRIVIVDFAPNTNKVAALAPILAEASKAATNSGVGGKGGKGWSKGGKSASASSASKAAEKALAAEEAAALLSNPNIAILQARAIAAAEAQAVRTATVGITGNSAARLTAMTASQQSKQREKLAPTSPSNGEAAPRSTPHFIPRTPPPPPDTTFKKARQSSHSISDMIVAHQSSSVAASLRESVTLSPEEVEAQAIMQQALERRRRNAATPQPRLPSSKTSRSSSRPGSASPSPRPSPRSGSAGEVRFAPLTSSSSAARHSASGKHGRHQSLSGSGISGTPIRSSKADRQAVSSRDSYDAALAGLATQSHHSHVFLPNVSAASAMGSNKERAAANVSMLTRLHEHAAELEKERVAAAAAALAGAGTGPNSSPRQSPKHLKQQSLGTVLTLATAHPAAAAAVAAASGSATGSPTLSALTLSSGIQSSSILDHREFAPDDQEYQHPLEVGMRREPRLLNFQIHLQQQQQRASVVATQQKQGEGMLSPAQLKTISMRRLAEGADEDADDDADGQQQGEDHEQEDRDAADEEAEEDEATRRRRSQESNRHWRPVHIAPVSISIDEMEGADIVIGGGGPRGWNTPMSPTHLSATTPLMSPASRTQLPQKD